VVPSDLGAGLAPLWNYKSTGLAIREATAASGHREHAGRGFPGPASRQPQPGCSTRAASAPIRDNVRESVLSAADN